MPTIRIVKKGKDVEYHKKLLKPLQSKGRYQVPSTVLNKSKFKYSIEIYDFLIDLNFDSKLREPKIKNIDSHARVGLSSTIQDLNTRIVDNQNPMTNKNILNLLNEKHESNGRRFLSQTSVNSGINNPKKIHVQRNTRSLRHSDLQAYLKTLQKTKKIQLSNILREGDYMSNKYLESSPSPKKSKFKSHSGMDRNSSVKLLANRSRLHINTDHDDIYLVHPKKILASSATNWESPRKLRRSLNGLGVDLKASVRKSVFHPIKRLAEDQDTFMKLCLMKESMLIKKVTAHFYHQDDTLKWKSLARGEPLTHYHGTCFDSTKFFIFGGMSNIDLDDVINWNINEETGKVLWEDLARNISYSSINGEEPEDIIRLYQGEISQASVLTSKYLSQETKKPLCINYKNDKTVKLTPSRKEPKLWSQFECIENDRQYHSSCVIGKYKILYGGINKLKTILGEVGCYNLKTNKWVDIRVIKNSVNRYIQEISNTKYINFDSDDGPGPLYHHRCWQVFYQQRDEFWEEYISSFDDEEDSDDEIQDPLIKQPPIKWHQVANYIKQEGIYCFGGKSLLSEVNNDVWCLKFWNKRDTRIAELIDIKKNSKILKGSLKSKFYTTYCLRRYNLTCFNR